MINNPNNANPLLLIKEITDQYSRKNFQNLSEYFLNQNQLLDFKFFEITFDAAVDNQKQAHGLKYVPQDAIVTKVTGPGKVSFNWGLFDDQDMDISTTDACTVRFFVGSYWDYQTSANTDEDAVTEYSALVGDTNTSKIVSQIVTKDLVLDGTQQFLQFNCGPVGTNINVTCPKLGDEPLYIDCIKTDPSFLFIFFNAAEGVKINGLTTTTLATQYESFRLFWDGTQYFVLARCIPSVVMRDPTQFTLEGLVTGTRSGCAIRRNQDMLTGNWRVNMNGNNGSNIALKLPAGLEIDNEKIIPALSSDQSTTKVGDIFRIVSGTSFPANGGPFPLFLIGASATPASLELGRYRIYMSGAPVSATFTPVTGAATGWGIAGDSVLFNFQDVPIKNWST